MTTHSPTLAIDEAVHARRQAGESVLHLGFGEAGLPAPRSLVDVLASAGGENGYGPVVGSVAAREAAAGWFSRRGLTTQANQILLGPGSKPLLFGLLTALRGDVVLPRPSWVSYAAQAALLGRRVISVEIPASCGGVPDPDRLDDALRAAKNDGAQPGVLVLTVPDNPTGTVASADQVKAVCEIADQHGLAVISDEIYAELCHEGPAPSAATYLPERTVVTSGLSKSLALGGWRIGFARTPDNDWGRALRADVTGIASEVWSSLAAPMQAVATAALGDPPELVEHIERSRDLHAQIARAVHAEFVAAGASCRPPEGGFYLYPDFGPRAADLRVKGLTTGDSLARWLLDRHGIAVLPGTAFGDAAEYLTIRVATSLLYGDTPDRRLTALASAEPASLPWVADGLAQLRHGLRELVGAAA